MEPCRGDVVTKPLTIVQPTREQRQAADPLTSVWVSANAGSGKTHVLVDRVVRLMLEGATPETILCLTFTKAAAAEMQNRLFEHLSQWTLADNKELTLALKALGVKSDDAMLARARQLFTRALETPGGLRIQTIHALSERLLRLFPVEAGVAPGFTVLDDLEKRDLLQTAQQSLFHMAQGRVLNELTASLALISDYTNENTFSELVTYFVQRYAHVSGLLQGATTLESIRATLATALEVDAAVDVADVETELCRIDERRYLAVAEALMPLSPYSSYHLASHLRAIAQAPQPAKRLTALEAFALTAERKFRKGDMLSKDSRAQFADENEFALAERARLQLLFEKRDLHQRLEATTALYFVAQRITGLFLERKRAMGAFDFDDLITRAGLLLQGTARTQWVLSKLDSGITHLLVDEAQDTNDRQWAIIRALSQEFFAGEGREQKSRRTLFVVGDRKQSIYSFQGADAQGYERVADYFNSVVTGANQQFPHVPLTTSYRSVPEVLAAVDQVFNADSFRDMGFATSEERGHTSNRPSHHGVFELWPMLADDAKTEPDAWGAPVDAVAEGSHRPKLARAIAQQVKAMIGRKFLPSTAKPVTPGDVLILFRKRGALFNDAIAALRQADIPVAGADRLRLNQSLTVHDLLALGQVMLLPEDDHALACVLKSPLVPYPLREDQLFALAHDRKELALLARLQSSGDDDAKANFKALENLRRHCDDGPYAFYARVMSQRRKSILARLGPEASDASDAFLEYALHFEQTEGVSLAGFHAWFQQSDIELKREMDEAGSQVRLMTVHGAKGLEAPIVIIADTAETQDRTGPSIQDVVSIHRDHHYEGLPFWTLSERVPSRVIDGWKQARKALDKQEKLRLLYVAMTRAKDALYIAGADKNGIPNDDSLYHYVLSAMKPSDKFKLHTFASDVFAGRMILRHGEDLEAVPPEQTMFTLPPKLPSWAFEEPAAETGRVLSVTGYLRGERAVFRPSENARAEARRGTAIHVLLEALAAVPESQRVALAQRKAAALGLSASDVSNVLHILEMAELQPILSEDARSEAELYLSVKGEMVTGRIDRMLISDDAIWLLDYKTTRKPPQAITTEDETVQQLALYAAGLLEAYPGRVVKAALVFTENQSLHWLTPDLITRSCELALSGRAALTA
jgi:ATP-dependent helicase/nuclease subunit A